MTLVENVNCFAAATSQMYGRRPLPSVFEQYIIIITIAMQTCRLADLPMNAFLKTVLGNNDLPTIHGWYFRSGLFGCGGDDAVRLDQAL
mmetsp:Transcript_19093/g.53185  ORF Transcript_19093/g.53185 Transcript_19093/m.53185 type:complete len:89 (+) Transcript_19093:356-622(+)